ncbi:hypothetical protein COW98_00895 [Candidatus Roizmanbacteria bacterium CG22_combo_CG10-13_8_21_14_all_35_9]|uniref:DUF5671 domain-containing protein n=1 Tax=Candidatus Roizmanbacteria bacterium CG22_combo_CG10-13_8_21_14_all_35_9 TaxID=1974861 RepID=A0A2H0BZH0_9BACT|nr:MAG: hypothetical protein COW98_00895 [Candidatus Roizmanbacteria bacterium CG22_combo_CG10-13_8_21_14_all_35_9]
MAENSTQTKVSPKHVFLHLFAIVMLYLSTANFITLIFQYINILLPDKLAQIGYYFEGTYRSNLIRFSLSSIIIVFPALIFISWLLNKNYKKDPAVRDMKTRKWLIYFTLFLTGLVIVGDLISIIWNFLGGEITTRFVLKSLSMLFVSSLIFSYYLWDVRREFPKTNDKLKYFVWSISALVLAVIITGFFLIGSPQKERIARFDQQRVYNLQSIQSEIVNYWVNKRTLPQNFSVLEDPISGYKVPTDPETNSQYEYIIKGPDSFELCAIFGSASSDSGNLKTPIAVPAGSYNQNWQHGAGITCFERTIDPQLYPPPKQ